jgi:asparagine synthase (glutamine-hydrolysing)
MCGITGFLDRANSTADDLHARAGRMAETLAHRGPDDVGVWTDSSSGVALGQRRLAIVDLSEHGHQPMHSTCGRLAIVFNGEIYNHPELRQDLQSLGHAFRGHCDTEVLLAALAEWGVRRTVPKLVGMFAFALWNCREKTLTLVRDAVGIKPLYYGWMNGCFLFGSELKALRAHPDFRAEIDRRALTSYLRHNCVPSPHSIYRGIFKLPPGTMLTVSQQTGAQAVPETWWSMRQVAEAGERQPFRGSVDEATDALDRGLREAVRLRMVADVPLGVFLSGGIDSSTVAALIQAQSSRPVRTFSIGFREGQYDESVHARAVAAHLGTEHTEFYVTPAEAREVIPRLPAVFDEPFADSSQIPTVLLCQITRPHVTVCLSGDGGDELFCGYDRYTLADRIWRSIGWCPRPLRTLGSPIARMMAGTLPFPTVRRKLGTLAGFLPAAGFPEFYGIFNSHWRDAPDIVREGGGGMALAVDPEVWTARRTLVEQLMCVDSVTYLPDDLLVKIDRASMAVGLEVRVPLLDHRVVELVWRFPFEMKVRDGTAKWLLRRVLDRYVPRSLTDRPKMGFGVPIDLWLRGPLREWAEELLDVQRLTQEGFFRPKPIRQKWEEHLSGRADWHYLLWDILMFQAWLEASSP